MDKMEHPYEDIWDDKNALLTEKQFLEMKLADASEEGDQDKMKNYHNTLKKIVERIAALL